MICTFVAVNDFYYQEPGTQSPSFPIQPLQFYSIILTPYSTLRIKSPLSPDWLWMLNLTYFIDKLFFTYIYYLQTHLIYYRNISRLEGLDSSNDNENRCNQNKAKK